VPRSYDHQEHKRMGGRQPAGRDRWPPLALASLTSTSHGWCRPISALSMHWCGCS
jgi:hypothetical protein